MQIETSTPSKTIEEYDISILSGMVLPVTIDAKAGDTYEELTDRIKVYLAPKPGVPGSDKNLPAEKIEIYKAHVVSVNHRTREVPQLTPEQQAEWQKILQGGVTH
jgi:hypothetical protein